MNDTIFIIGLMGCGKSTIGRLLAEQLSLPFFDTDDLIATKEGCSITTIFEQKGEPYFRKLEHQLIKNWKYSPSVCATGGGLPCFYKNMDLLLDRGLVIFLDTSLNTIITRISGDLNRPLVKSCPDKELLTYIEKLYYERIPYYRRAHYTIKSDQATGLIVDEIRSSLSKS
jgi:shikimate kinase